MFLPARTFKSVVLPAPETPMSAQSTPGLKAPLTLLSSCSSSPLFLACSATTGCHLGLQYLFHFVRDVEAAQTFKCMECCCHAFA